jgi:flagellum-specific ATP synthase
VLSVCGLGVEIDDRLGALDIGARVEIERDGRPLIAEAVGAKEGVALCLPFGPMAGIRRGARARFLAAGATASPSPGWLGRIVDGLGRPIDGRGDLGSAWEFSPPPDWANRLCLQ